MLRRWLKSLILEPPLPDKTRAFPLFDIPENAVVLRQWPRISPTNAYADQIKENRGRYAYARDVAGHPELIHDFWHEAGEEFEDEVRWVVRGIAVLAHPETKIIFAHANGTHSIQVRLPVIALDELTHIDRPKVRDPKSSYVWVEPQLKKDELKRLFKIAFEAAASTTP
jgi:hypothetical protein